MTSLRGAVVTPGHTLGNRLNRGRICRWIVVSLTDVKDFFIYSLPLYNLRCSLSNGV